MGRYGRHLSLEEARELRILRATVRSTVIALAELYGISETSAHDIIHGKTYRDAGGPVVETAARRPLPPHRTPARYAAGCRCAECSEQNRERCLEYRKANKDRLRAGRLEKAAEKRRGAAQAESLAV